MKNADININLVDSYYVLLKNLSPENKLELIARLSKSMATAKQTKDKTWKSLFGSLALDQSVDEFIDELEKDRKFNRKEVELWKSTYKEKNIKTLETFQTKFGILPIFPALGIYAKEKARLKTKGKILDDFDLLIGATAIFNNLILVTKNVSDFDRLEGIIIEDWTSEY